jgi:cellulose synthase/poly-beta-1,6-N-acetylglucosamine synthase-like glycosyltransferase
MENLISFIIPAYNNEETIENCLHSVMAQDCNKEVIVVDNGSADNTKSIVKKFPVTLLSERKKGAGAARNRGLKDAQGIYIAFVDADAVLPRIWCAKAIEVLKEAPEDVVGCGGPLLSMGKSSVARALNGLIFGKPRNAGRIYINALNASGALFDKKVFDKVMFDESFVRGQDTELGFRMRGHGFRLLYDSNLFIYHKNPTSLAGLLKKWFKYGKSYPLSYLKHKKMRNSGFYARLLFIPVLLSLIALFFIWEIMIYLALFQLLILFFSYVYTGLKIPYKYRGIDIISFSFVHTVKQFAQLTGIWFGFFERGFSKPA